MSEQLTLDGQPVQKAVTLHCYVVDDLDFYAATSAEEAKRLHCELNEYDEEDVDDCCLVVGALLDKQWIDEDNREPCGTLRQWLAEATEPGWIAGTE